MPTLLHGDAVAHLRRLPAGSAQCIIADPPYFQVQTEHAWDTQWENEEAYLDWTLQWVTEAMRVLKPDGLCFIFGQPGKREHAFLHLMSRVCARFQFHDLIIWDRVVGANERRDSFTPCYEMILVLRKSSFPKFDKDAVREPYSEETIATYLRDPRYKDKAAREKHLRTGKYATNILRVPSLKGSTKEKCGHPTQKPLALIEKLIAASTDPGDLVLDPFLGSGTTAVAAHRLGRRCTGIEVSEDYFRLAQARLSRETEGRGKVKVPSRQ